jgi:formamidopyrimidine-DNA glycosylase
MPELPEVERARRLVDDIAVGRKITRIDVDDDNIVFAETSPRSLARQLLGAGVNGAHRHGKQLWIELTRAPHLLIHLGMSGSVRSPGDEPLHLKSAPAPEDVSGSNHDPSNSAPRYTKLRMELDDAHLLFFTDPRRFGRVLLRRDPRREPPIADLGIDPSHRMPSAQQLGALLDRKRSIKSLLLDQRLLAGIGNWMADEVLYRARIDPRMPGHELDNIRCERLRDALRYVIDIALAANADDSKYPSNWLFHYRWRRDGHATAAAAKIGGTIEFMTVGSRTTAWVPALQDRTASTEWD